MDKQSDLLVFLLTEGYYNFRVSKVHGVIGLHDYMFTTGLVIGLTDKGYRGRYCYETREQAQQALEEWHAGNYQSEHPPGPWIKYKGHPEELVGPGCVGK